MRLPRMTVKRWFIAIAVIALAIALRQFAGHHCRQQAFYYGAFANSAMMNVAGFESEAEDALKDGDDQRYSTVTRQLATAQSQQAFYLKQHKRYEMAARLLGMPVGPDYVPPGFPQPPTPNYSGSDDGVR